jgi:hypothetical protein
MKIEQKPKFKQQFYIKASNSDQKSATFELAIIVCGSEKI